MSDRKEMKKVAADLQKKFLAAAEELDKHGENCTIAKVVGGSVGIVGGVVAVVAGLASGPAGALVAAGFAASGTALAGASQQASNAISERALREAQEKLDAFKEQFSLELDCDTSVEISSSTRDEILKQLRQLGSNWFEKAKGDATYLKTIAPQDARDLGEQAFASIKSSLGSLFKNSGWVVAVINAAVLPLNMLDLINDSIRLHRIETGIERSKAGDVLRGIAFLLQMVIDGKLGKKRKSSMLKCLVCGRR